jgi:16S rRNA (adenine1518-N6/adenine1519-N6)-dimethyltransferase
MKSAERQTRTYLMKLFSQHGFHPRTHLGQNFLIDLNIVEFIVDEAQIGPDDVVLEIGAGTGGMTTFLAAEAGSVISVEVDRNMFQLAEKAVERCENVTLVRGDALANKNRFSAGLLDLLETELAEEPGRKLKLVSNLPFSIATPVVANLVATDLPWERMVITIQLELGERMIAKPRTSDYGSLSIWLQSQCWVKVRKRLRPSVFWPRPKVHSAIVRLLPNERGRRQIRDRPFFQDFLRRLFHQRRKLLRSVLVTMYRKQLKKQEIDAILESLGMTANARAEELAPSILVELSNSIWTAISIGGIVSSIDNGD